MTKSQIVDFVKEFAIFWAVCIVVDNAFDFGSAFSKWEIGIARLGYNAGFALVFALAFALFARKS